MTGLSELRPGVASEARDCPNPVIDRALVDAARELCEAAAIWRDAITVDVVPGTHEYALVPTPEAAEIVHAIEPWVSSGGHPLYPGVYEFATPRRLVLRREPVDSPLVVHVQLRPVMGAEALPDVVGDHREALQVGALARLLRMRNEPWADIDMSLYYARLFRSCRSQAIASVTRGFTAGGARVRPRRFAFFRN